MADAVSSLMQGKVIFDPIMEKLWTAAEFVDLLKSNNNAERPDFHVRVVWRSESDGCYAVTKGLRKVGIAELRSEIQNRDHEVLVSGLLLRMAFALFRAPTSTADFEIKEHGDEFKVKRTTDFIEGYQIVKIQRSRDLV
jgi:hypothetical protein